MPISFKPSGRSPLLCAPMNEVWRGRLSPAEPAYVLPRSFYSLRDRRAVSNQSQGSRRRYSRGRISKPSTSSFCNVTLTGPADFVFDGTISLVVLHTQCHSPAPIPPSSRPLRTARSIAMRFESLIESQIAGGVEGIVPVGTTGESPTLSHEEHSEVIQTAIEAAGGRCRVIAGTGSNSTAEAISLTREAERLGADAALLVAPYYNKPSQEGVYRHYRAVAGAVRIPIVLYSIPGRCGIEIAVETVARLAKDCANIVGIKEAGGSVERVSQLQQALPAEFEILSGDDSLTLPFLCAGGVGVISVASNLLPQQISAFVRAWREGRVDEAVEAHRPSIASSRTSFIEPNPVPIKYALSLKNGMSAEVRLPLCEMSAVQQGKIARHAYDVANCMNARLPISLLGSSFAVGFSMTPLKLLINGARGRMGQTVVALCLRRS